MKNRLVIRETAELDLAEAAMWYQSQGTAERPGLGDEFLAEVHRALESLLSNPRQFPRLRRVPEVRRILLSRFPYRLFFILTLDEVIVFRVLHGARHDREWKRAVPKI